MGRRSQPLTLRVGDKECLEQLVKLPTAPNRDVQRARIVLLAAEGLGTTEIATRVGVTSGTVSKWKRRYSQGGFFALSDAPRSGRPRSVTDTSIANVVALTLEMQPEGATHWSTRELARHTGMSQSAISRIWRAFRLQPHRKQTFELSPDPYFVDKVRDIVGLYLEPPDNAVVFCVDEKTQIQALERSQTVLPMGVGRPTAFSPKYLRHGITDLFAGLEVATGRLLTACHPEHKSAQFTAFLAQIDEDVEEGLDIHIIVDNASIHRSVETNAWLSAHPRFHMHYTPTYASWLNLAEVVFSLLYLRQLKHGVHTSIEDLIEAIEDFVNAHNADPKPFIWTKTADQILESVARYCGRVLDRHGPNAGAKPRK